MQEEAAAGVVAMQRSMWWAQPTYGLADFITMQRNAAGVWGVPRFPILPPRLGARGLILTSL